MRVTSHFKNRGPEPLEARRLLTTVGDFNSDGVWNVDDIDMLTTAIATQETTSKYDLDIDGRVSSTDVDIWLSIAAEQNHFVSPYLLGDANLDGVVDAEDLNQIAIHWQSPETDWSKGNFIPDSIVDAHDLNALAVNWQQSVEKKPTVHDHIFPGISFESMGATQIKSGDFNGDGIDDFVTTGFALAVLFGRGDGTFTEPTEVLNASGDALTVADFNGDGIDDIAVHSERAVASSITLIYGASDADFGTQVNIEGEFRQFGTADFNVDGRIDLAVYSGDEIQILLQNKDQDFHQSHSFAAEGGFNISDVNGDSIPDITSVFVDTMTTWLGTGKGTLGKGREINLREGPQFQFFGLLSAGDLNNDGHSDFLLSTDESVVIMDGMGDGTFTRGVEIMVDRPRSVRIADFNNDGIDDILLGSGLRNRITLYFNDGNGNLSRQASRRVGSLFSGIVVRDFNGDGKLDVATGTNSSTAVSIILADESGLMPDMTMLTEELSVDSLVAADFNNDGRPDVATISRHSGLAIWTSSADGSLNGPNLFEAQGDSLLAADFTGDGNLDLVTTNSGGVYLHIGNGSGGFGGNVRVASADEMTLRRLSETLTDGDFNGDGIMDLAYINSQATNSASLGIALGGKNGQFAEIVQTPIEPISSLDAADLNGDGMTDIVGTNVAGEQALTFLFAKGNGRFTITDERTFTGEAWQDATDVELGDLNNDGLIDVVATLVGRSSVGILYNQGNGTFQKPLEIPLDITASRLRHVKVGDVDGNGALDIIATTGTEVIVLQAAGVREFAVDRRFDYLAGMFDVADFDADGVSDLVHLGIDFVSVMHSQIS